MKLLAELFTLLLLAALALGFMPKTSLPKRAHTHKPLISIDKEDLPGTLGGPDNYFDPVGFSQQKWVTPEEIKKWREAEVKHGRVAMLAVVGILVAESFNPLFGGTIIGPAIFHFQQITQNTSPGFTWILLSSIGVIESISISKGWQGPSKTGMSYLKDDWIPGDLGFDPLSFNPDKKTGFVSTYNEMSDEFKVKRTKELNNGRTAMVAVAGMIAQELVDKRGILEHLYQFGLSPAGPQ